MGLPPEQVLAGGMLGGIMLLTVTLAVAEAVQPDTLVTVTL